MKPAVSIPAIPLVGKPRIATGPPVVQPTLPQASVIIVNYNGREHLEQCLRSLFALSSFSRSDPTILNEDRQDYEIILVDNASIDGSAGYVEQTFPEALVIRNEANQGFGQGNNVGAQRARGDYLAFLNPDTVVEPGWLEALVAALEADPQAGLATSKVLLLADPERINTCGNEIHVTGLTLCRGLRMDRSAFTDLAEVSAVSGAAFVIRKDLFEALDGFDEAFFLYMEDTDLSWRARLAGYRCIYVPSSVVYHDYTLHFGPEKTFYQERNRYLLLLKGLRWPTLVALLPALIVAEVVTWGFVLLRDRRPASKLRAYAWILKHWGQVMESRRQTQALRQVRDRDLIARCAHRLAYEQVASGLSVRLAHAVFDPLFLALHRLVLALVWW